MNQNVASFAAMGAFAFMLAGTSKDPVGTPAGTTAAPTVTPSTPASAIGALTVPSSAGWPTVTLAKSKLQLAVAPGWTAIDSIAGEGAFELTQGGEEIGAFEISKYSRSDVIHAQKNIWEREKATFVFRADDAVVVHQSLGADTSVEAKICTTANGHDYCAISVQLVGDAGLKVPAAIAETRAMQLIAMARTLKHAP